MKVSVAVFLLLISSTVLCQSWTYGSEEDTFTGKYSYAQVVGTSNDRTYPNPILTINRNGDEIRTSFFITNIGFICEGISVMFKFDDVPNIYKNDEICRFSNKSGAIFFPDKYLKNEIEKIIKPEFYELMKKHNVLHIRIEDGCNVKDCKFSLSGSTKALNHVLKY